jgi:predicted ArsR family transcriptional regulator
VNTVDKDTQRAKILSYCMAHGSITVRDACVKLDINSPTKRISEMRLSPDYDVQSIEETKIKDNGDIVRYKRYFIQRAEKA